MQLAEISKSVLVRANTPLTLPPIKDPLPQLFGLGTGGEANKREASDEVDADPLNSKVGSKFGHIFEA